MVFRGNSNPVVCNREDVFPRVFLYLDINYGISGFVELQSVGDEIHRCDRALLMNALCSERLRLNLSTTKKYEFDKSLIEELEARGYDIDTLKLSIEKKV